MTLSRVDRQRDDERRDRILNVAFDVEREERVPVRACNHCSGTTFVQLTHSDRYGFPVSTSACLDCGLVFLDPVMTAEAYARFYRHTYRSLVSAYHGRLINARTVQELEQEPYADHLVSLLSRHLPDPSLQTLLDIGGSTGLIADRVAKEFGLSATVLDPSPDELAEASARALTTIEGFLEDAADRSLSFDVILMCRTVDHLLDLKESLLKVRSMLTPNGLFFVDIVDFRAAYLRSRSVEEATKVDHPYYLTESPFEALLSTTGFELVAKDYASDHLHIGYICSPAAERVRLPDPEEVRFLLREIRAVQNYSEG